MRIESPFLREIIITTFAYTVLGFLAIPTSIVTYTVALNAGFNERLTLLVLLGILVLIAWFIRPRVEHRLSVYLLGVKPYNLAASEYGIVQITDPLGMKPALTAATAFSLLLCVGGVFGIQGSSEDQNTIVSKPYHELSF